MEKEDILKGIENKGIYDFISQQGYLLSKDELITIIKEVDYALFDFCEKYDRDFNDTNPTYKNRVKRILEELNERL